MQVQEVLLKKIEIEILSKKILNLLTLLNMASLVASTDVKSATAETVASTDVKSATAETMASTDVKSATAETVAFESLFSNLMNSFKKSTISDKLAKKEDLMNGMRKRLRVDHYILKKL